MSETVAEFQRDPVVTEIIAAAIEVHRRLGPGLLESTYQVCLVYELVQRGIRVEQQVPIPVFYKGVRLDCGYRIDLLVDDGIIVEIKSVATLLPIHTAQVLTYLRLTGARQALILNFNALTIKAGLKSYLGDGNKVTRASDQGSDLPDEGNR
jgi:GxxExxY protein